MIKTQLGWIGVLVLIGMVSGTSGAHGQTVLVGDCIALEFVAAGNPDCERMRAATEQALEDGWVVRRIDVRHEPQLAERWRIHSTPTTLLVRGGREIDRILTPVDYSELSRRMIAASSPDHLLPHNRAIERAAPLVVRGQSPNSASSLARTFAASIPTPNSPWQERLTPMQPMRASGPSGSSQTNAYDPSAATVRIRVEEGSHEAVGTGTVVDNCQGEALVVTCGHLFRDMTETARVRVELFQEGRTEVFLGAVIDYQAGDMDIGLVAFKPGRVVPAARLMSQREVVREGDNVFSYGCDHGQDPSRRDSQITRLNRYVGAPNIEVAVAPVQGRSGGGLFNAKGELIGICYAADPDLNEGLYCGPEVVYQQLAKVGLQKLYSGDAAMIASAPDATAASFATSNPIAAPMTVILRDRTGAEQQIRIDTPSPQLLQALQAESAGATRLAR
jgi:S1-C subfamily serine protease